MNLTKYIKHTQKGLLLVLGIMIMSCNHSEKKVNYAVVRGNITNKTTNQLFIASVYNEKIDTINIAPDGHFIDTLRNVASTKYIMYYGIHFYPIYIEPGDDFSISFDANKFFKTIKLSGKPAIVHNYYDAIRAERGKFSNENPNLFKRNSPLKLSAVSYKAMMEANKVSFEKILDTFPSLPKSFKKKEQKNIYYSYLGGLKTYITIVALKTGDTILMPKSYVAEFKNLDYENGDSFIFSGSYRRLIKDYYKDKASVLAKRKNISQQLAYLEVVNTIKNDIVRNNLLYAVAKRGIFYTNHLESYYKAFMKGSTNKIQRQEIAESYKQLKTVVPGSPSPNFENYINYAGGTTSLADLKGKYIYIDIWATWCGPCRAEIPYLKKIEETYKNKNITFVSISIDKRVNEDKWRKLIKKESLGGIQLLAEDAWNSKFTRAYSITAIPRFILLDPNLKIVSSNAPRPSDPKLKQLFSSLGI